MPSTTPKQWEVVLNLTSCGFRKPRSLWLGPILVATVLVLGAIGALVSSLPVERTLLATAAAATAGGLLVALQQAVRARQEVSLERFFDRLELTTRRRLEAASARMNAAVVSPDERETDEARERYARELWVFYVFSEIDTLDYMMKRYQLGALTKEQARRAISHFRNRCLNLDGFHEDAEWCIDHGAYDAPLREAVEFILDQTRSGEPVLRVPEAEPSTAATPRPSH